jgi:hypothetical protein
MRCFDKARKARPLSNRSLWFDYGSHANAVGDATALTNRLSKGRRAA